MSSYHAQDPSFDELMAQQLRRAPWLGLSIVLHGLILLVIMLIPMDDDDGREEVVVAMLPPEKVEQIEDVEPEPEKVEDQPVDDVVVPEPDIVEPTEIESDVTDPTEFESEPETAFNESGTNPTVGLGGNAGGPGKYGRRGRGGGGGGAHNPYDDNVQRALQWLADHQDDDGHWDADEFMKHDVQGTPCDGAGNPAHDVGITGLALLAFLGAGHTMNQGEFQQNVKDAVMWLREQQDPDNGLFGTANSNEFLYDHSIATLAMVEACGLSNSRVLRKYVQAALNYLEYHRNPYGAWRYQPRDGDADVSVTGWCLLAYKSAQDFEFPVNTNAIELTDAYFEQMTDPDTGRTGYNQRGGLSSRHEGDHEARFPRDQGECMSAVALLCNVFMGHDPKNEPLMRKQAELVARKPPVWDEDSGAIDHYAWYYGTYALYQIGGTHWKKWSRALGPAVAKTQRVDGNEKGSWDPVGVWGDIGGRVYSTAMLCLTLEAYQRYTRVIVR